MTVIVIKYTRNIYKIVNLKNEVGIQVIKSIETRDDNDSQY